MRIHLPSRRNSATLISMEIKRFSVDPFSMMIWLFRSQFLSQRRPGCGVLQSCYALADSALPE